MELRVARRKQFKLVKINWFVANQHMVFNDYGLVCIKRFVDKILLNENMA